MQRVAGGQAVSEDGHVELVRSEARERRWQGASQRRAQGCRSWRCRSHTVSRRGRGARGQAPCSGKAAADSRGCVANGPGESASRITGRSELARVQLRGRFETTADRPDEGQLAVIHSGANRRARQCRNRRHAILSAARGVSSGAGCSRAGASGPGVPLACSSLVRPGCPTRTARCALAYSFGNISAAMTRRRMCLCASRHAAEGSDPRDAATRCGCITSRLAARPPPRPPPRPPTRLARQIPPTGLSMTSGTARATLATVPSAHASEGSPPPPGNSPPVRPLRTTPPTSSRPRHHQTPLNLAPPPCHAPTRQRAVPLNNAITLERPLAYAQRPHSHSTKSLHLAAAKLPLQNRSLPATRPSAPSRTPHPPHTLTLAHTRRRHPPPPEQVGSHGSRRLLHPGPCAERRRPVLRAAMQGVVPSRTHAYRAHRPCPERSDDG